MCRDRSPEAWDGYVKDAIRTLTNNELQTTDWVVKTASSTNLTLEKVALNRFEGPDPALQNRVHTRVEEVHSKA